MSEAAKVFEDCSFLLSLQDEHVLNQASKAPDISFGFGESGTVALD